MKKAAVLFVLGILVAGCGGGGSGDGGGTQGEAVKVVLTAQQSQVSAAAGRAITAAAGDPVSLSATATNVGTVTVRGFILTHYDGGAGLTLGAHDLFVCQKCFDYKDNTGLGGCNFIFEINDGPFSCAWVDGVLKCGADLAAATCKEGQGAWGPSGWTEHAYMPEGTGYCDNAAENPELDCAKPATWRVLTLPIMGFPGGGSILKPGESMMYGDSYQYPTGTYEPSAAVYRWDGTLFDNDVKTVTVQ